MHARRALALGALATAIVATALAIVLSSGGSDDKPTGAKPAAGTTTAPAPAHAGQKKKHRKRAAAKDAGSSPSSAGGATQAPAGCPAGQYTDAGGQCRPIPAQNAGSPPANSPEGEKQRQANPDCQHLPPPPPDYTGPVQC